MDTSLENLYVDLGAYTKGTEPPVPASKRCQYNRGRDGKKLKSLISFIFAGEQEDCEKKGSVEERFD